jgi:hypothetical protein
VDHGPKTHDKFVNRSVNAITQPEVDLGIETGYRGTNLEVLTGGPHGKEPGMEGAGSRAGERLDDPLAAALRSKFEAAVGAVRRKAAREGVVGGRRQAPVGEDLLRGGAEEGDEAFADLDLAQAGISGRELVQRQQGYAEAVRQLEEGDLPEQFLDDVIAGSEAQGCETEPTLPTADLAFSRECLLHRREEHPARTRASRISSQNG